MDREREQMVAAESKKKIVTMNADKKTRCNIDKQKFFGLQQTSRRGSNTRYVETPLQHSA